MIDERTAIQESQLREQHRTDEWYRRELLEIDLHRKFVLLLLHHEGHLTEAWAPHFESCPRVVLALESRSRFPTLPTPVSAESQRPCGFDFVLGSIANDIS